MAKPPRRDYDTGARGTLNSLRVLDLSRLVAGNMLTQFLADFGAEVIKVEPPAGDTLRAWKTKDIQINWKIYARNKKSLGLELRKPEARELLLKLVPSAQMFIESFRPGTLEKMGLGPDVLFKANPKLVIVRISGWARKALTANAPASARWLKACRVSRHSTVLPTANQCCRRCILPTPWPDSTALRR